MADPTRFDGWLELLPYLGGGLSAAGSLVLFSRKFMARCWRAVRGWDRMSDHFGEDPAVVIAEALQALQVSASAGSVRNELLSRKLSIGWFQCDTDGEYTAACDHLGELFGLSRDDMLGVGWLRAIHETERLRVHDNWRESIERCLPYSDTFPIVNQRTGVVLPVRSKAYAVVIEDELLCWVGYIEEVTE